jgi:osmotically-inducible protein OsmY
MAVADERRTDARIRSDVLMELERDARVSPNEMRVAVTNGVVTLTSGDDLDDTERSAAEEAARRAQDVTAVHMVSSARVPALRKAPTRTYAPVNAPSNGSGSFRLKKLEVTISNGWMTLRGEVGWHCPREAAHDMAPSDLAKTIEDVRVRAKRGNR